MHKQLRLSVALIGFVAATMPAAATSVHASGQADLTPTRISVKTVRQGAGCEADIQATIKNIGVVDTGGYSITFNIDGGLAATAQAPNGTNAGRSSTESVAVAVSRGTHTVTVVADSGNQVQESNETNNTLSDTFTCR